MLQFLLGYFGIKFKPPGLVISGENGSVASYPELDNRKGAKTWTSAVRKTLVARVIGGALIFATPLIAYWPTVFHYYGLRDSYSNLREAHEEPGKLVQFCASHARPIYGWLLQITLSRVGTIHDLQWIRLLSALLLGAVSFTTYRLLRRTGWPAGLCLLLAIWLGLVPSAQVIAGWAIGWPYSVAVLVALGAFYFAEQCFARTISRRARIGNVALAVGLVAVSALIYQPNSLFYVVPITAGFLGRRKAEISDKILWVLKHVATVCGGLALAYAFMQICYSCGIFHPSARIAFEHHWGDKMLWFLREPLPNSLSLFAINDDHHFGRIIYLIGASLAGAAILIGGFFAQERLSPSRLALWAWGLASLPVLGFSVNLLAAECYATYRTIFALTGILLCFLLTSTRALLTRLGPGTKRLSGFVTIGIALLIARSRAHALLAVPQGNEWSLVEIGAAKVNLAQAQPRIFAIEPSPDDISTTTIYHDEFGSLSSNSDWVPKEMFKRAIHDLHPKIHDLDRRYYFASGPSLPRNEHFDVIIDFRQLRLMKTSS